MGKRIFLFLLTNLAIVVVLSTVLSLLGVGRYISATGQLDLKSLAIFSFVWGMAGSFLSLLISRWIAKMSVGAKVINGRTGDPTLDWVYETVARLAQQKNLPMPEVAYYPSREVNAFATGPSKKKSLVAVSAGLLSGMRRNEVEAVLAHEIGHIANGDMVTMTLLQGVMNAFVIFFARVAEFLVRGFLDSRSDGNEEERGGGGSGYLVGFLVRIVFEIALGILGSTVTAWYSRRREFHADAAAASLSGKQNMIAALRRLMGTRDLVDNSNAALASFKIAGGRNLLALFATHPPLERRIAALEAGAFQP